MKAVVKAKPGPGIEVAEVKKPEIQREDGVLVKVKAAGICGSDIGVYKWEKFRDAPIPRVIGHEFAGTVIEVSSQVRDLRVGDRVVGDSVRSCGRCFFCRIAELPNLCEDRQVVGREFDGAFAEYFTDSEIFFYRLPENISFEEASCLEPLGVAVHAIEKSRMKPGDSVAVLGPGPIGQLALQVAKAAGAGKTIITGMGVDRERLRTAERFRPDLVINIDKEDPVETVKGLMNGRGVDLVIDATGSPLAALIAVKLVRKGGQIVMVGTPPEEIVKADVANLWDLLVHKEIDIQGSLSRHPHTWHRSINLVSSGIIEIEPLITVFPVSKAQKAFEALLERKCIKAVLRP